MSDHYMNTFYLILIFIDVTLVSSKLVDKSELKDLENSFAHHFQHETVIKKIPDDCTDQPHIRIDKVFKDVDSKNTTFYAVFGNGKYYIRIEGITSDHLPIIRRDTQPALIDSSFERKFLRKSHPISEYEFVGPVYLYKVPNENGKKYLLVGFNQVWVGCPQPLCLSPGMDAILSFVRDNHYYGHYYYENTNIIFRGNYYWPLDIKKDEETHHAPLADRAGRIDNKFFDRRAEYWRYNYITRISERNVLNDSMVVPTYMDAVVPGMNRYNSCIYFFKNENFICYEMFYTISSPLKIATQWKANNSLWANAKIDAAFNIKTLIYFIAGDMLWCFDSSRRSCISYPKPLIKLHKNFPINITSAFIANNYIYIIKGPHYYKIKALTFPNRITDEEMIPKYIFQDIYGCDEGLYTSWGFENYDNFIEKIVTRMYPEKEDSAQFLHLNETKETHFNPVSLIISLIFISLCAIIIISIWFLRPQWIKKVKRIITFP